MIKCKDRIRKIVGIVSLFIMLTVLVAGFGQVTAYAYSSSDEEFYSTSNGNKVEPECDSSRCTAYKGIDKGQYAGSDQLRIHMHYCSCTWSQHKANGIIDTINNSKGYASLADISTYGANSTFNHNFQTSSSYKGGNHKYYDEVVNYDTTRLQYLKLLEVEYEEKLTLVAANDDVWVSETETIGGSNKNSNGSTLYWIVNEWDKDGNSLTLSKWYETNEPYYVGTGDAADNQEQLTGYNTYLRYGVKYATLLFRWNNGDTNIGSGTAYIPKEQVADEFERFYVCYKPFTYTFKDNGNVVSTMERFGVSNPFENTSYVIPDGRDLTPRKGYHFTGWKITSGGSYNDDNKQHGMKFTADELNEMMTSGDFYSSLFADTIFEAVWEPDKYSINYDLKGGTLATANPTTYDVETSTFTLNNPTRTGYKFTGWTGSNGTTPQATATITKGSTGDKSYTANWETTESDVTVKHYVMDVNGNFPANPTKTNTVKLTVGKSFANDYGADYFKDSSLEQAGVIRFSGYVFPSSGVVSVNSSENVVKLYYSRSAYTVKYNVSYNGGMWDEYDNSDWGVNEYYGANADLSLRAVKNGYEFVGWNTDKDAITALSSVTVTGDTTLYAVYKKTITIGFTDSQGRRQLQQTVYNKTRYASFTIPYIRNYDSWSDVVAVINIGWTSATDVYGFNGNYGEFLPGENILFGDNEELYAVYKGHAQVTYDENGGNPTDATKDTTVVVHRNAADLSRTMGGDVVMPGCERQDRNNGDGTITAYQLNCWKEVLGEDTGTDDPDDATESAVYPSGSTVTITGNTNLIAVWDSATRDIEYTIVFDMNGGKNGPDPIKTKYGTEVTLQDKGSRVGFDLAGWNTKADGTGTAFEPEAVVKNLTTQDGATVTLYAQWKQKKFLLVKISSSRYGATFIRRTEGDDAWFNSTGKITIDEWAAMTEDEKTAISQYRFHIDKDGNITQTK